MADLSVEETNALRAKLGLALIPVAAEEPAAAVPPAPREAATAAAPRDDDDNALQVRVKHMLSLAAGQSVTLTLAESSILADEEASDNPCVLLEDVRLTELQKGKSNARKRKEVEEYLARGSMSTINFGERMEGDEETISHALPTSDPPPPERPKFKKRRKLEAEAAQIDWGELFGTEDAGPVPAVAPKTETWQLTADGDAEEDILHHFKASIERVDPPAALLHVLRKEEIKKEEDVKDEGLVMNSLKEFTRSLQTPLEKLEETSAARRGVVEVQRNQSVSQLLLLNESREEGETTEVVLPSMVLDGSTTSNDGASAGGLTDALKYLKANGAMKAPEEQPKVDDDVKLEHVDAWGRVMGPKDAFRDLSYRFHGKGPGKKKQEKKLLKMVTEKKLKTAGGTVPTLKALRSEQAKGKAFLVLNSDQT